MEKIFCRLCGSWLVYEAPHTGDDAVAEHRRVNHPVIGHAKTVIERDEDIDNNEPGDLSPEDERLADGLED
jgi:hypothetical protein